VPRTVLYLARPLSDYELVYSDFVEAEAERHQKAAHIPVSTLRKRWDWQIVPDAGKEAIARLSDTDDKDKPVLAAAIAARATLVVTGNVRHFGAGDLSTHGLSAVHPGLFLSHHTTAETYREVLAAVAENRSREPHDPLAIHEQEIAVHLPALFAAHRDLFGPPSPDATHRPPAVPFRGVRCIRCTRRLDDELTSTTGLCDTCQADTRA
ncbi:MAG: hypothetical protein JJU45_06215, partial [Acidimicrobiia bacterium]|nr:hypothetical protein [Acidimicrobiia bacterium]